MMKRYKKAQGLSLNMVAVGVISITLLVIIVAIFITSMDERRKEMGKQTEGTPCTGKEIDKDKNEIGRYEVLSYEDCSAKGGTPALGTWTYPAGSTMGTAEEPIDGTMHTCCFIRT